MKKPEWICGDAESWGRMESAISKLALAAQLKNKEKTVVLAETLAGIAVVGGAAVAGVPVLAFGLGAALFLKNFFSMPSLESSAVKLLVNMGERELKKALKEESLNRVVDLRDTSVAVVVNASTVETKFLAQEIHKLSIESLKAREKSEMDKTEAQRVLDAAMKAKPDAFGDGGEWRPSDLARRFGTLGQVASDGVAAATMAQGMMNDKRLDQSQLSELKRVTDDILPKLLEAYESIPKSERDVKMEELEKTPTESFSEGLSAALTRVLAVRQCLTNKAKIVVEAERNVLKSGL